MNDDNVTLSAHEEEEEGGEGTPPTVEEGEPEPLELPETDSTQTSETGRFCSYQLSWLPDKGHQAHSVVSHFSSISTLNNSYRNAFCD